MTRLRLEPLERRLAPATFTVLNANDAGPGSLRQAILDSNALAGGDTIDFAPAFFNAANPRTITLDAQSGELLISDSLTINGPGPAVLAVSGGGAVRVFKVNNNAAILNVVLNGLTVTGGRAVEPIGFPTNGGGILVGRENLSLDNVVVTGNSAFGGGGGIAVGSFNVVPTGGTLTVRNSTISGNTDFDFGGGGIHVIDGSLLLENSTVSGNVSRQGGGVYLLGEVGAGGFTLRNSTIAGNTADLSGGGVQFQDVFGEAVIQNCTITGNISNIEATGAGFGGGGIGQYGTSGLTLRLVSTVVSGNAAAAANGKSDISVANATVHVNDSAVGDPDGFAPAAGSGNNLPFGAALGLGPLADNGGPTQTVAFGPDSPLRDAGSNPAGLATDQRGPGFPRTSGAGTDIGAFELSAAPRVAAVNVNAGQANAVQRSRVTSIDVEFSTVVNFAGPVAAAFDLSRIGGGAVGGFTATANVVGGVTVVTLTGFTGAETQFGSLADGRYRVVVRAAQVTAGGRQLDGDGDGTGGDNFAQTGSVANGLFANYGDVTGDGVVNAADFGPFRSAFGTATGNPLYRDFLDFNGDGFINAADFAQFRSHFGATVP